MKKTYYKDGRKWTEPRDKAPVEKGEPVAAEKKPEKK